MENTNQTAGKTATESIGVTEMQECNQCEEEMDIKYLVNGVCGDCHAMNEGDRRFEQEAHGED